MHRRITLVIASSLTAVLSAANAQSACQPELQSTFAPTGLTQFAHFGVSVDYSAPYLIAGAREQFAGLYGAAYIYRREAGSAWTLEAQLVPPFPESGDEFGWSVAIDGTRALVGAPKYFAGHAYLYEKTGSSWNLVATISVPDTGLQDDFLGEEVAIEGNVIAIGAWNENFGRGVVHMYDLVGGLPVLQQTLDLSDLGSAAIGARFGESLSLSGGRLLVGAARESFQQGGAHLYERVGGVWTRVHDFHAPAPLTNGNYGIVVHLSGSRALVTESSPLTQTLTGSVHVYEENGGAWNLAATLSTPQAPPGKHFGFALEQTDDQILVGADLVDSGAVANAGAVYRFELGPSGWVQTATIETSPAQQVQFGYDLVAADAELIVGAPYASGLVSVVGICTWKDLGGALAGSSGAPSLAGDGTLLPAAGNRLTLTNGAASSVGLLAVSSGAPGSLPLFGGVLQAFPPVLTQVVTTNGSGSYALPFSVTPGLAGTSLVFQIGLVDTAAVQGVALSNALSAQFP